MLDVMGDQLVQGPDYLDRFADLSAFLSEEPLPTPPEVSDTAVTETSVMSASQTSPKRKLDSIVAIEPVASVDHDYVSKKAKMVPSTESAVAATATSGDVATNSKTDPDEKYRYRRTKNNIASKRSRETRKMKYVEMEDEASRLVKENANLRERVEVLEKLAKEMKTVLVEKLASAAN